MEKIYEEMIKLVDKERIRKLLTLATWKENLTISDEIVDRYLNRWAISKVRFYKLFGNKLRIMEEVDELMDTKFFFKLKKELNQNFLQYVHIIENIPKSCFIQNKCTKDDLDTILEILYETAKEFSNVYISILERFHKTQLFEHCPDTEVTKLYPTYTDNIKVIDFLLSIVYVEKCREYLEYIKRFKDSRFNGGIKLSKVLSKIFNDAEFDIELSKIMQHNKIKTKMYLSIDPYDYLTCSHTTKRWRSCYNIYGLAYRMESWSNGSVAMMVNEATVIGYTCGDKDELFDMELYDEYIHRLYGGTFTGNAKTNRWIAHFDEEIKQVYLQHNYPTDSSPLQKLVKRQIEELIGTLYEIDGKPNIINNNYTHSESGQLYSINKDESTSCISFNIPNLICANCGGEIPLTKSQRLLCNACCN